MTDDPTPRPARKSVGELAGLLAKLPADAAPGDLAALRARYREGGLEGLDAAPRAHPQSTPAAVAERILALALDQPAWGCVRIAEQLVKEGKGAVSSPTVQKLLIKHGLGGKPERVAALEEAHLADGRALTPEQVALVERANPGFRERASTPKKPGVLVIQECFLVGNLPRLGNVYLHAAVDAANLYAFGFLYQGKRPECAVALLHNDVLPFYEERHVVLAEVMTDTGWEYGKRPYQFFLRLNDIQHRVSSVRGASKHGGFERFHELARDEFCRRAQAAPAYASMDAIQAELDAWLVAYNHARPLAGFPNRGRTPADMLAESLA